MNNSIVKLLGTAVLISFGYSASAQTVIDITVPEVNLNNTVQGGSGFSPAAQNVNIPGAIDISVSFDDLPVDPNQALATANAAVTQVEDAAVQINSIATNVASIDASVDLNATGTNGSSASGNFASAANNASSSASEAAGNIGLSVIGSSVIEGSVANPLPGGAAQVVNAFNLNGSAAFSAAESTANSAAESASGAFAASVDPSTFDFGDVTTAAIGVTNTTEMGFLGDLGGTIASAANTSNTAASFGSFNAGGMGLNALATNTASINASVTGAFSGGSASVGNIGTTAVGAINNASFSGRSVTVNVN